MTMSPFEVGVVISALSIFTYWVVVGSVGYFKARYDSRSRLNGVKEKAYEDIDDQVAREVELLHQTLTMHKKACLEFGVRFLWDSLDNYIKDKHVYGMRSYFEHIATNPNYRPMCFHKSFGFDFAEYFEVGTSWDKTVVFAKMYLNMLQEVLGEIPRDGIEKDLYEKYYNQHSMSDEVKKAIDSWSGQSKVFPPDFKCKYHKEGLNVESNNTW